jgi:alkylated DNA repair dioxygenase AlkB
MLLFDETALFDEGKKGYTSFDIPDAELRLWEQFFTRGESDDYFRVLKETTPWQQRKRMMYDKWVIDPRLTAYYGGPRGLEWTDVLLAIKARVEAEVGIAFNRVLLNYYRDGNDSVAWHSDTLPADGRHHAIASVTFGETRVFKVRRILRGDGGPESVHREGVRGEGSTDARGGGRDAIGGGFVGAGGLRGEGRDLRGGGREERGGQLDIPLMHGSFLLMGETMQDHYEHHIPKTSKRIGPRINLTFRISDSTKPVYYVNQT